MQICVCITQEGGWGREEPPAEARERPLIMPGVVGKRLLRFSDFFSKGKEKKAYLYVVFPFILSITHGCKLLLPPDKFHSKHYFS